MVYFKQLICINRQCLHRTWVICLFDSIIIGLDLEQNPFDINLRNIA